LREIRLLVSKKGAKFLHKFFAPITFFMNYYPLDLYQEILICYDYETRNPTVYGNVVLGKMESSKSSKELRIDGKGDENHI
jgi:hypothetical protein